MKLVTLKKFTVFLILLSLHLNLIAQTVVKMPKNKNPISKDIELGKKYSQEAEKVFPVLNDYESTKYVQGIGRRLVAAIPAEYQHPEFNYEFKILNCSDINAFAIAGGHLYVCRGMIEGARNEGEMVGVMSHEISHAALRHTTAKQAGTLTQIGALGMILGGAIFGGEAGAQLGQVGAAALLTPYSREFEKQADLVGARIMSIAGYDPHDLANMFKTIEGESQNRPPQWLSSHPDPGNRYNYINAEADKLRISPNPIRDTKEFQRQKARLKAMKPPAKTMEQLEKEAQGQQGSGQSPTAGGQYSNNVPLPSSQTRQYNAGNLVTANIPNNWKEFPIQNDSQVWFAPNGAYGDNGITHGAILGVTKGTGNFQQDTQNYVNGIAQSNGYQQQGNYQNGRISGRNAVAVLLAGKSSVYNGTEYATIYTTQLSDGSLLYLITVVPQNQASSYQNAFNKLVNSIRITDR